MSSTPKNAKSRRRKNPSPSPCFWFFKEPPSSLFPSKQELPTLLIVVAIALFVAVACYQTVWLLNRQPKPFCDTDETSQDLFYDLCELCPKNGQCFKGNWECLPGYKKHGRLCVEDGEMNCTAKKLFEWVEHHVCEAYARFLCGGTGKIWFHEEEILKEIDENNLKDSFRSTNDTFMFAKQKAMEKIRGSLEKRIDLNGIKEFKCPDLLSDQYKPLLCRICQWTYHNIIFILLFLVLLLGLKKFIQRICWSHNLSTRAEELYQRVCDILEEDALLTRALLTKRMNIEGDPEGYLGVVACELRFCLLLPRERKDTFLWNKVEELVHEDSRIDQYSKLVKGKSRIVWEWQGSLSSRGRTKGAVSKVKFREDMYNCCSPPLQTKLQPALSLSLSR